MSLVGTRPILQDELRQYELHHRARIAIKPGITGMWQVSGRSDITDFKNVRTRSLTNIDIMISTIPGFVFKVKKIIEVSKINRFKSARIGGTVITMFGFVIYLKALATMLITNSHFDTILQSFWIITGN